MHLSFNAIVTLILTAYVIWMAVSEHRKEQASTDGLTDAQRKAFAEHYSFGKEMTEYPEDLRDHVATIQRARVRKGVAVILLCAVAFLILFRGL